MSEDQSLGKDRVERSGDVSVALVVGMGIADTRLGPHADVGQILRLGLAVDFRHTFLVLDDAKAARDVGHFGPHRPERAGQYGAQFVVGDQ